MVSEEFKSIREKDLSFMRKASELAERGKGFVNPNPLVGALIVKGENVIGEGWHEYYGGLHAERNALKNATESVEGATMYVTLEPCCHYGKTPPCTEAIIEHKISRVVIGLTDPNPQVAGKGIELLRAAGIEVVVGVYEEELKRQNRVFLKYITTGKPWVVMKSAMTLDGKIAAKTGDSKWVSGEESRKRVQYMRAENMGIMVGINTVVVDDPMLNSRVEGKVRQPVRIVVDSKLRVSVSSKIIETAKEFRTVLVCTSSADALKIAAVRDAGAEVLVCGMTETGHVDLGDMLEKVGKLGIDSILLEGGGELNFSFLQHALIDEVYAFIAPKYIGGKEAKTPVEGDGFEKMSEAVLLEEMRVEACGEDLLVNGLMKKV